MSFETNFTCCDVYLFHGTISENIAYVSDILISVNKEVFRPNCTNLFCSGWLSTVVGERGIRLSGGQRQRLSIARAIIKNSPVMIFDEATSSVDTETEREIQANLSSITKGKTALVIAHRLSTIRHADRIIVIRDGKVAEEGHHDDLVLLNGTYADLWHIQSGD